MIWMVEKKIKIKALKGAKWTQIIMIFKLVQNKKLILPNTSKKISNLKYTKNNKSGERHTLELDVAMTKAVTK